MVAGPDGPTVLTASAASPLLAGMLEHAVTALGGAPAEADAARTADVVPADPRRSRARGS